MTKKYWLSLSIDAKNNLPETTEIELTPRLKGSVWSESSILDAVIEAIPKLEEIIEISLRELRASYMDMHVFTQEEGELTKAVTYKYSLKAQDGSGILKIRTTLIEQALAELELSSAMEISHDITSTFIDRLEQDLKEDFKNVI